jgi:hypothetical protein
MSSNDEIREERDREERERHKSVADTISKASAVLKEKMSLDADVADADLKYSEWMAALATAGFALTLGTFEKINKYSWLSSHPKVLNAGLIFTCLLFLAAIACSAAVLRLFRSFRAGFNETRALGSAQEVLLLNHVKVFAAQAEVDVAKEGLRSTFSLDFIYNDVVERKGGGLVRMAYEGKEIDPNATYEKHQVAQEFGILAAQLDGFKKRFEEIEGQMKDRRWLTRFGKAQKFLISLGYIALLILASSLR